MIAEIQTKIKPHTPLILDEIICDGGNLVFRGTNWHFSAITSWRLIRSNKFLCGSDIDTHEIINLLRDASIIRIEPQSIAFPVDPALFFDNGCIIEVFSDASYDTWTLQMPDEPLYDFAPYGEKHIKIQCNESFLEIERTLPLTIQTMSFEDNKLILRGNNSKLTIASSWRFVDQNTYTYGASENGSKEILSELKNISIDAIHAQSSHFPIDPVLYFSNGFRLEIFSASPNEPWIMQLPNGKIMSGKTS